MKRLFITLVLFLFSMQLACAQKMDTSSVVSAQDINHNYIVKYKKDKAVALMLLVPGSTMVTIGGVINSRHGNVFTGGANSTRGTTFGLIGGVMAITSIPFFIAAGKNRKIACLSVKSEKVTMGRLDYSKFSYPAIAFRIKF
ncbi:MAG: hypothetical protein ACHQHN_15250 [Sphingobacteriales bacterium]